MIEERLENWGRVMRDKYTPHRCRSIEGRYVPERIVGEAWEARRQPKTIPDVLDAFAVEDAWRRVTSRHQKVLKFHYIWQASPAFICRRLSLPQDRENVGFLLELGRAQRAIRYILGHTANMVQDMAL